MAFDYLSGLAANLVTASGNVFSSSSEDANYRHENIAAGWPAKPFKFNAAAADDQITVDFGSAKSVSICGVHGHNIDSGVTAIQLRKSSDNFSGSDVLVATMTKAFPTFFVTFGSTSFRYWRLKFVGTNAAPIEVGEWVLGAKSTLTNAQLIVNPWAYNEIMPQNRQVGTNVPQAFANNLTTARQRSIEISFLAKSYAERDELRDLFTDTKFGEEPLVCVPDPDDEIIIHGRLSGSLNWERIGSGATGGLHRTSFTVEEDPFSIALP